MGGSKPLDEFFENTPLRAAAFSSILYNPRLGRRGRTKPQVSFAKLSLWASLYEARCSWKQFFKKFEKSC